MPKTLRALGGGAYLIQKHDLAHDDIRACFTVSLLATVLLAGVLWLLAQPLATFFAMPQLAPYLRVATLGYLTGPFTYPIGALLSRRMAFGPHCRRRCGNLPGVRGGQRRAGAARFQLHELRVGGRRLDRNDHAVVLDVVGGSFDIQADFQRWGSLLKFGVYDSATALITQLGDTLPYFIFGKLFTPAAVGLAQRAVMLCMMPERVVLAGVSAVALPAFAQEAREGRGVRGSYLRAIELVTAAQWPSLLLLALLAQPLVGIVLGSQWLAVAPLMRILAVALMFAFPIVLHYAMVVSVGAIRYMPAIMILQALCSVGALTLAAVTGCT